MRMPQATMAPATKGISSSNRMRGRCLRARTLMVESKSSAVIVATSRFLLSKAQLQSDLVGELLGRGLSEQGAEGGAEPFEKCRDLLPRHGLGLPGERLPRHDLNGVFGGEWSHVLTKQFLDVERRRLSVCHSFGWISDRKSGRSIRGKAFNHRDTARRSRNQTWMPARARQAPPPHPPSAPSPPS